MIVTDIVSQNKKKAVVYLDGKIAFVLYKGDFKQYGIEIDEELSEEDYKEITEILIPKRALDRSYNLLMTKDYTEKQLREKLRGDAYPEAVIDATVEKLKAERFLDDRRYAENYIFWKAKERSRNRIFMDLAQKGIDSGLAEEVYRTLLEKNDINVEANAVAAFLEKKKIESEELDYEEREKLIAKLLRKGFSYDSVKKALKGEINE